MPAMQLQPTLLVTLRGHRGLLSVVVLAALAFSLALFLGGCLTASAERSMAMAAGTAGELPIPCPEHCTGEASTPGDGAPGLATSGAAPVAGVVLALLALLGAPPNVVVPSRPFLPKRPRTLKFYALRI